MAASGVCADVPHENKVDRPALFPPTFLYTQSWEDPDPDMQASEVCRSPDAAVAPRLEHQGWLGRGAHSRVVVPWG